MSGAVSVALLDLQAELSVIRDAAVRANARGERPPADLLLRLQSVNDELGDALHGLQVLSEEVSSTREALEACLAPPEARAS